MDNYNCGEARAKAKRAEALSQDLERWRERHQILEFVAVVEAKLEAKFCEDPEAVQEWIDWARGRADRLDPLAEGLPKLLKPEEFHPWELT
jgi:hypothetical protein